jgi:hypothetical protein
MDQSDSITLTIRSFLFPDEPIAGFQPGEAFTMKLPVGTTLEELTGRIFFKKFDQIGVTAVNGKLAAAETILLPGDAIDFYPLLDGG